MNKILEYFGLSAGDVISVGVNLLLIVIVFVCLWKLLSVFFKRAEQKLLQKDATANVGPLRFIKYLCLVLVGIICLSAAASYFPAMNTLFTSLLAGSGVVALVLSVASQDAISNLVGGLMILFTKPFKIGDIVRYVDKDITGVVEEITLRHTIIRTFENKRLVIPNATINNSVIENADFGESRVCVLLDVDITYESDEEKAMAIFAEVIRSHPRYMDLRTAKEKELGTEAVKIRVVNFASSSVVLRGWIWAENSAVGVDMKSDILRTLKQRFEAEGIEFAYPHMVVVSNDK